MAKKKAARTPKPARAKKTRPASEKTRAYWQKEAGEASLAVVDGLIAAAPDGTQASYASDIALRTTGKVFCRLNPRRKHGHVLAVLISSNEAARGIVAGRLTGAGLTVETPGVQIRTKVTPEILAAKGDILRSALSECEAVSRA